uniref:Uncharacterized protein n=1 Tax=Solanum lycopersicum TaxID=4081 RepID=A0A3Q7JCW4_SOLLC
MYQNLTRRKTLAPTLLTSEAPQPSHTACTPLSSRLPHDKPRNQECNPIHREHLWDAGYLEVEELTDALIGTGEGATMSHGEEAAAAYECSSLLVLFLLLDSMDLLLLSFSAIDV